MTDALGRLTSITEGGAYDYTSGVSGNNGQIQKLHYYTTPGVEDQTKSENFTYDQMARLSAAQTGVVNSTSGAKTWSLQWTYDRFGNRLTQSMLAGDPSFPVGQPTLMINSATNQITTGGYTYDNAGNMTHDATAAYAYDGANRLININTSAAVYSYFGPQRIKKVVGSTTTRYIYSGSKPIAEYVNGANASSPSTEYVYAGSQLLVTIAGSTTTYHHPDHLSNRAETNSSGTRIRTFGQLPFGETWYETGTADKWKFTSYERDSGTGETGLDYANFRYYSSGLGRFLNTDLMSGRRGAPQSLNHYSYGLNDPVTNFDPLGLVPMSIDFTVCETPYITQVYDDGHTTTITGSPVCNTYSMLVDFGWGGGPTSPAGGPDQNKVDISKLRERLAKALQSDTNCLTFLSIGGAAGALGVLDSVPIDVGNYGPAEQGDAFTSYGIQIWGDLRPQNPQIHINENGYFSKTGQTALIGGVGGTPVGTGTPAFQAIVMFHELGHATGALPRDGSHANQSLENDKTIMEKCKDAINNFVKNST